MNPARIFSRRKMCSKVRMTEVVPAPEEPVTAMMGWRADMSISALSDPGGEQAACAEERRLELEFVVIAVIALDSFDLVTRTEHEADALVGRLRLDFENWSLPRARPAASLLDQQADRIGLIQQPQTPGARQVLAIAGVHEYAAAHQDPVGLRDERGDPAHVEIASPRPAPACQALLHIALDRRFPVARVGGIDREL